MRAREDERYTRLAASLASLSASIAEQADQIDQLGRVARRGDRQRLADERRLLLMVARMAADLALWTAHGKRNEALEILALVRQIEGAPGVGGTDGR